MYGNGNTEDDNGVSTIDEDEAGGDEENAKTSNKESTGRWTHQEHQLFLRGLELYGKGWKKIACLIKTRAVVQIRTHAQKYFLKLSKARQNGGNTGESLGGLAMDLSSRKRKRRGFGKQVSIARPLAPFVRMAAYCSNKDKPSDGTSFEASGGGAEAAISTGAISGDKKENIDVNESLYNFLSPVLTDPTNGGGQWYRQGRQVDTLLQDAATLNWLVDSQVSVSNVNTLATIATQEDSGGIINSYGVNPHHMAHQGLMPDVSANGMNESRVNTVPRTHNNAPHINSSSHEYSMKYDDINNKGDNTDVDSELSLADGKKSRRHSEDSGNSSIVTGEHHISENTTNRNIGTNNINMNINMNMANTIPENNINMGLRQTDSMLPRQLPVCADYKHLAPDMIAPDIELNASALDTHNKITRSKSSQNGNLPRSSSQRSLSSLGLPRVRSLDDCTLTSNMSGWDLDMVDNLDADNW